MNKNKIRSQKEIIRITQRLKKQSKKIVTCNGSFDILHPGHFVFLKECKKQGDILILCLNSDKSVRAYKGPTRPINQQDIRIKSLAILDDLDYLVIFDEINPKKILSKIKPHIHCVGQDWGKDCVEKEVVEKNNGKIYIARWKKGFASSRLIKTPTVKAVFLDRDGTINVNKPEYLHRIEDFKFIPRVLPALKKLSQTNYKIIIVTNQSGIGRGYFTERNLKNLHSWMLNQLKKEKIRIDKIYYCPHHPRQNCACRKPKTVLIEKAARDFGIDLSKSWIIGDDEKDILMGKEVNLKTILIGGKVKNLERAVKIILSEES